jgi:hypothetical protein
VVVLVVVETRIIPEIQVVLVVVLDIVELEELEIVVHILHQREMMEVPRPQVHLEVIDKELGVVVLEQQDLPFLAKVVPLLVLEEMVYHHLLLEHQ